MFTEHFDNSTGFKNKVRRRCDDKVHSLWRPILSQQPCFSKYANLRSLDVAQLPCCILGESMDRHRSEGQAWLLTYYTLRLKNPNQLLENKSSHFGNGYHRTRQVVPWKGFHKWRDTDKLPKSNFKNARGHERWQVTANLFVLFLRTMWWLGRISRPDASIILFISLNDARAPASAPAQPPCIGETLT